MEGILDTVFINMSDAAMMLSVIYEKGVEEKLYVWLSIMCDDVIEMDFGENK